MGCGVNRGLFVDFVPMIHSMSKCNLSRHWHLGRWHVHGRSTMVLSYIVLSFILQAFMRVKHLIVRWAIGNYHASLKTFPTSLEHLQIYHFGGFASFFHKCKAVAQDLYVSSDCLLPFLFKFKGRVKKHTLMRDATTIS